MGLFDIPNLKLPKMTSPKIKSPTIAKMRISRRGERTLTSADKKKEMRNVKHTCQKCKKKFPAYLLDIHHRKSVSSHKSKDMIDIGYIEFYTKRKKKASYDRSKNLMVLCPTCHREVHKEESNKKKVKKKPIKKNPYGLGI